MTLSKMYCNANLTDCTVNYHDFTCDDEVMRTCRAEGGQVIEGSLDMRCSIFRETTIFWYLNKMNCLGASCDEHNLFAGFEAILAVTE
jgi:hypothetical protein